ncbi:MAG: 3'-5' exonuclease [Pseudomonadota bacterium]
MRPGDVIILLRARAPMMAPLIRRLKKNGTPVAGADRLSLREELAVRDLLALMRFATTPTDDLTLAALLRSPLFDVDEDGLFALAYGRPGTLWAALRGASDRWPYEVETLSAAIRAADFVRPYEFLERALIEKGGRRRMIARLGREAEDAIDELLAQALAYEAASTPSFEGFLGWMEGDEAEIKREQAPPRPGEAGEVRVMTAHGAKGLEAPVVILPDTTKQPETGARDVIVEIPTEAGPRAAWRTPAADTPALLQAAKQREADASAAEHRRLLYVAMTRAEDWLIVAGAGDPRRIAGSWYDVFAAGIDGLETSPGEGPAAIGETRVYEEHGEGRGDDAPETPPAPDAAPPDWLLTPPPPADRPARRRTASDLAEETEHRAGGALSPDLARLRGDAIHAALEDGTTDAARIRRIISAYALPDELIEAATREAEVARRLPEAADFFAPDALAEVGVALDIDSERVVGRIDRLALSANRVAFVDFKSDAAPSAPGAAPQSYLMQAAAYRAALQVLHPGRKVEAYLLWTAIPRLDPLDPAQLDAAAREIAGAPVVDAS